MKQTLLPKHRFRDPIYGYIWLNDSELKIIDTPVFQRLRRIGQLALNKYVYPTAEHSRFVHSLGVLQAGTNMFDEVLRFNPDLKDNEENYSRDWQTLRFAALLHDIGHLPFSHAAEKFYLGTKATHEDIGKNIIENVPVIADEITKHNISPKTVASLLKGKPIQQVVILKKFISDEFDADRADFLLRDSYFCGVKYGEYDYIRYAGSFRLVEREGERLFAIEKGNLHAVESFLLARYHYYLQVPYHRTRQGYDLVLERYFQDLQERGKLPDAGVKISDSGVKLDIDKFAFVDDYTIFECIKADMHTGNPWAKILMRQERLHPIFDTEKDSESNRNNFLDMQHDIVQAGLREKQDFFVFEKKIEIHKKLEKSDEKGEETYPVVDKNKNNKIIGNVLDFSPLLTSTKNNPAHIRRIYVTDSARSKAEQAKQQYEARVFAREKKLKGGTR